MTMEERIKELEMALGMINAATHTEHGGGGLVRVREIVAQAMETPWTREPLPSQPEL